MEQSRETSADILKGISIVLVLLWHLQPVTKEMIPTGHDYSLWVREIIELFYRYITLLAVPTFMTVSLYLFMNKLVLYENYWEKRLLRLSNIFLFWVSVQFIFYLLADGGKFPPPFNTVTGGGPELSYVGGSVFYFLFVLIKCTFLSFLFFKLPEFTKPWLSIIIISLSCIHFFLAPFYGISMDSMSMMNFYAYIPVAYYLVKCRDQFSRFRVFFLILFVSSIIFEEWGINPVLSAYGRLSIFFGVLSFNSFVFSRERPIPLPLSLLAKYSLGIFALHKYWQFIFMAIIEGLKVHWGAIKSLPLMIERPLLVTIVVFFTCSSVYLFSKTRLRVYLS